MDVQIEASGGVLWRPAPTDGQAEIAIVHRPKYDDWSVPKGKLNPGEHVLLAALREVEEETGIRGILGPPLGAISYAKNGQPKRVRYWSMRALDLPFRPNAEVDDLRWLTPAEARTHLGADRDAGIVARFAKTHCPTRAVILLRHASAGDRNAWPGDDHDRPLDEQGRLQADSLVEVLSAYDIERIYSADVIRCLDTVAPLSARRRLPISSEPLLSEAGVNDNLDAAAGRLLAIAEQPESSVLCTQRGVLNAIVGTALRDLGGRTPARRQLRKAGFMVMHLSVTDARLRAVEEFDPPAGPP